MTEGKEMIWRRTETGFVADNENAERLTRRVRLGETCVLQGKIPRNIKHHRWYWALIKLLWENQEHYTSQADLHVSLKFAIGHTKELHTGTGVHTLPMPTDFMSLDQVGFDEYCSKVLDVIFKTLMKSNRGNQDRLLAEVCERTCTPLGAVFGDVDKVIGVAQ